jgi:hypothetical protein
MTQVNVSTRTGWSAILVTAAFGILGGCSQTARSPAPKSGAAQHDADSSRALLSTDGQALLRTTIGSGNSDLRWPDFSDYTKQVTYCY